MLQRKSFDVKGSGIFMSLNLKQLLVSVWACAGDGILFGDPHHAIVPEKRCEDLKQVNLSFKDGNLY